MSLWKLIRGRYGSGAAETADARLDSSTDSWQVVSYAHHEVHSGSHYAYTETDPDLDASDTIEVRIATPNTTKWAHLVPLVSGALHTKIELFEDCTHTAGAAVTAYNSNRNSANTTDLTLTRSANDNADGTLIMSVEFGVDTGAGANRVTGGGVTRGDSEWILKQNAVYLVRATSLTDNNVVSLALEWYEHTNRH